MQYKLEVGHSVRTVEACIIEATHDVTITTNLMESRTLVGNEQLRETINDSVGPDNIWPSQDFYKAKMNEQANRYQKYNDTKYMTLIESYRDTEGSKDLITKTIAQYRDVADKVRFGLWLCFLFEVHLVMAPELIVSSSEGFFLASWKISSWPVSIIFVLASAFSRSRADSRSEWLARG